MDGAGGRVVGRVAEVWRYPVKSMGGESLPGAWCEGRGMAGDRAWAVIGTDGKIGSGKTTRRFRRMPGLLGLVARTGEDGAVWVGFPDGREGRVDDPATAARVGEVVREQVVLEGEAQVAHLDDGPLHLVGTEELAALQASGPAGVSIERRRFRPNLLIEGSCTFAAGTRLALGDALTLTVAAPTVRCVMTTLAQPGLEFAPAILKHLEHRHGGCFGVYATVQEPGRVAVSDPVVALP